MTRGGPIGLHKGGPRTRDGDRGQFQGIVYIVKFYGPSQYQTPQCQCNASVSKLFIILFHYDLFNLMCILLFDES